MTRFAVLLLLSSTVCSGCSVSSRPDGAGGGASESRGIIMLRYVTGSESTAQREDGFLETLQKEYPRITVLSSDQYAGGGETQSLDVAQRLLLKFGDRVEGIFAVCEPNAAGVLQALEESGQAGKVKFVGFDPSPRMVQALADGKMAGIVLQDPVQMGYLSVKTMIDHLEGREVEKRVATGEYMATPENMKSEEMSRLLSPIQFDESDYQAPENPKYRIAVIPKGTSHEFWKSVHAGAVKAAKEFGNVEILWRGTQHETDREGQINIVQNFITKQVDGIVLAPLDSRSLVNEVKAAKEAGIPTVIFDSGLDDPSVIVSYVATDNYHGGLLAARRMAEVLGQKPQP